MPFSVIPVVVNYVTYNNDFTNDDKGKNTKTQN